MKICVSAFIVGKTEATDLNECQDAIWVRDEPLPRFDNDGDFIGSCQEIGHREIDLIGDSPLRFAVADGVTTAFYSGSWARQLVSRFGEDGLSIWEPVQFLSWQEESSEAWLQYMNSDARELGTASRNRLNQRDPAASTFCGIEILAGESEFTASWRAKLIGDSCVFHLTKPDSKHGPLFSYPYKSAAEFSRATKALTTYTIQDESHFPETELEQLHLREGDFLILATDALSEWMLKMHEQDQPVWKTIAELNGRDAFGSLIANARRESDSTRQLKDDDVALIVIRLGDERQGSLQDEWVYEPGDLMPPYMPSSGPSDFEKFLESLIAPDPSVLNEDQRPEPAVPEAETDETYQSTEANPDEGDEVSQQPHIDSTPGLKRLITFLTRQLCRISKVRKPAERVEANP